MPSKDSRAGQAARTFTEEARRAQIVQHAITTIAEIGYPQASMEQIARRAGISRSLISYHFAGREELIEQVLAAVYTSGAEFMTPLVSAQTTASGALKAFIAGNLDFIDTHREHVLAAMSIVLNARRENLSDQPESAAAQPRVAGLTAILDWGQKTGEFRKFSSTSMAICILQAIDGAYTVIRGESGVSLADYRAETLTTFNLATRNEIP
jgi:AcrR family transcriptional regulator